jgi:hypothetical protein
VKNKQEENEMRKQKENSLYEQDFCLWSFTQANLLRKGKISQADIENIAEEIETLGRSEKSAIKQYLINLLMHKLKIEYQPEKHTKSWDRSIVNSQTKVELILQDNPSLRRHLIEFVQKSYPLAIRKAAVETGLNEKIFPKQCPWTIEEILM